MPPLRRETLAVIPFSLIKQDSYILHRRHLPRTPRRRVSRNETPIEALWAIRGNVKTLSETG